MLNFLTTTTVCGFSLYHVLAFFLIYSCTGWCLEVIFAAATTGQLVNRGFLNGPVCPIYGFGMVIVLFALTPLQDSVLLLYIGGVILPSALELVGGWALYKLYHTRWWDYSDFPFNIGGYICLEFSLLWGVGTLVVMRIVHPVVAGLVDMVPPFVGFVVMCVLYAVYAADVVVTAFAASGLAKTLDAMEQLADSIHAVSDAMTQLLGTTTLNADQKLDEQRLQLKLAAAEAREAQGVELDGGDRILIDAQFHVHGNAAGAHHLVHGRQPRREAVVPGVHDGTVGEVHAIGSILRAGEVVAQDVKDMGCAALVEVGVQGVFRAREVTLDKVLAAADDAFRIALVPPVLAPGDIGHGGRPVLRLFNNVDAHRAKPHGGLQHHRQRQVGDVHRFQPRAIDGFVEQART